MQPEITEAEAAVLGSIVYDNKAYDRVASIVGGEDFARASHRAIWQALARMSSTGTPIDDLTLTDELRRDGKLDAAGGIAYIAGLSQAVSTAAAAESYARIVADTALLRRVKDAGAQLQVEALRPGATVAEVREAAQRIVYEATEMRRHGDVVHVRTALLEAMRQLEDEYRTGSGIIGVPTGLVDLDRQLGGLRGGDFVVIAARPAMGKTALALDIVRHAGLRANTAALVVSLEMAAKQLAIRLAAAESRVNVSALKQSNSADSWSKYTAAADKIASAAITIADRGCATVSEIRSLARDARARKGLGLLVVDYLQLLEGEGENRVQEITGISRSLKNLARELDIPLVVLSQLNRAVEQRTNKRPQLSDLRDSGSIEQDADIVIFIYREDYYTGANTAPADQGIAELHVAKHRNGPTGTVKVSWQSDCTRFDNLAWS